MASFIKGAGPHPNPLPTGPEFDKKLLLEGDSRNVIDKYRYLTNDAIIADLDKTRAKLQIAIENLDHDFNIGTVVRNANAFNVSKVHIIGRRQWNKRGAMVTNRYLDIVYHPTVEIFLQQVDPNYELIAIDNQPGAKNLSKVRFSELSILIFGSESDGISSELATKCSQMIQIEQFGSTRSVNVGVASGIAIYAWVNQHMLK